jgi:hypothetical protein
MLCFRRLSYFSELSYEQICKFGVAEFLMRSIKHPLDEGHLVNSLYALQATVTDYRLSLRLIEEGILDILKQNYADNCQVVSYAIESLINGMNQDQKEDMFTFFMNEF